MDTAMERGTPPPPIGQPADQTPAVHRPNQEGGQFSPDGRWWWNGEQWVPAPQQTSLPPFAPATTATNSFLSGFMGCGGVGLAIGTGCMVIVVILIVLVIIAGHGSSSP